MLSHNTVSNVHGLPLTALCRCVWRRGCGGGSGAGYWPACVVFFTRQSGTHTRETCAHAMLTVRIVFAVSCPPGNLPGHQRYLELRRHLGHDPLAEGGVCVCVCVCVHGTCWSDCLLCMLRGLPRAHIHNVR